MFSWNCFDTIPDFILINRDLCEKKKKKKKKKKISPADYILH